MAQFTAQPGQIVALPLSAAHGRARATFAESMIVKSMKRYWEKIMFKQRAKGKLIPLQAPPGRIGGTKASPVSQGKKIQVSCDTSVMNVSTSGRPIGLA